ncbi:MAG TPA: hypothetical protein VM285_15440 [Polyangia bacterium]|nr:hypothetical protein [Polyangia bacterium]
MSSRLPLLVAALLLAAVATPATGRAGAPDAGLADGGTADRAEAPALPPDRQPAVRLTVGPREASIGDAVTWTAVVRHRIGDRVHLPAGADFGSFEVLDKSRETGPADGDWVEETLEVRLIAFETGELVIPAQELTVVDVDGRLARVVVEESQVAIRSLIANEPEPELKLDTGPGEQVFEEDYTLLWILAALAAALLVALLTLLARWLLARRRPRQAPLPPPRPPEEIALEKLEALERSTLLAEGLHKEFHVLLSEAVREYLGGRYGFYALESSTEEILAELAEGRLPRGAALYARIRGLLTETDLVKFAKALPAAEESRELLDQTVAIVHATTPRPAPAGGTGRDA